MNSRYVKCSFCLYLSNKNTHLHTQTYTHTPTNTHTHTNIQHTHTHTSYLIVSNQCTRIFQVILFHFDFHSYSFWKEACFKLYEEINRNLQNMDRTDMLKPTKRWNCWVGGLDTSHGCLYQRSCMSLHYDRSHWSLFVIFAHLKGGKNSVNKTFPPLHSTHANLLPTSSAKLCPCHVWSFSPKKTILWPLQKYEKRNLCLIYLKNS